MMLSHGIAAALANAIDYETGISDLRCGLPVYWTYALV